MSRRRSDERATIDHETKRAFRDDLTMTEDDLRFRGSAHGGGQGVGGQLFPENLGAALDAEHVVSKEPHHPADRSDHLRETMRTVARGPREACALGKKAFNKAYYPNLAEGLTYEGVLQEEASKFDEHLRRVNAFFERRKTA